MLRLACRRPRHDFSRLYSSGPPQGKWWTWSFSMKGYWERRARDVTRIPKDRWQYNTDPFDGVVPTEQENYPTVTAQEIRHLKEPPREVKMLVRDWIEDSLYNPNYGYFPRQANIYVSGAEHGFIDFNAMADGAEFQNTVNSRYLAQYGEDGQEGPGRQMWHTPTELFRPYYGQAIANCLATEYEAKYFPHEDLIIYELGAGNGSLCIDILDYLKANKPDVYDRTQYHIIEESSKLALIQRQTVIPKHPLVKINHKSIFDWNRRETAPCYVLALEVIDNFGGDLVRYDLQTMQPYHGLVTVSKDYDLEMIYQPVTDPLVAAFLDVRRGLGQRPPISRLFEQSPMLRNIYDNLPLRANLSQPEFVPTRVLSLFQTLRTYFPLHRLLLSDFYLLPETIPGVNAPVVQTRIQGETVATKTLLVQPGWFDIFFPTDFERLRELYEHMLDSPLPNTSTSFSAIDNPLGTSIIPNLRLGSKGNDFFSPRYPSNRRRPVPGGRSASGLPVGERKSGVYTHEEFLKEFSVDLRKTTLKNGENPMLEFYTNVKFLF